ncbi:MULTISPECIES: siroheme synthase CysG [Henriciella]|jgi:uroporphyrin-III C-methyltransferase/precorrin-2 dehydrogenase/sirohydrochlorin ferrochelatase|uniref:Siroheme synthase n=1 Tax=Henriciella pelagia TaxID=1977912 RepID=A0ABQ1JD46_9PROT|nr:siroheme synthase CysG [Henriciella pelagia]GGB63235.1 siroheme synthase [Henriciella pelagia]
MRQFPAFFLMDDAHVVIFGDGINAERKARLVAKTNASIRLITDTAPDWAAEYRDRLEMFSSDQAENALFGARFAIVALDGDAEAEAAVALAHAQGVPVNAVDRKHLCDFTVPSILDRGDIVAAVATGGAAPVLAKDIRAKLETLLPERIGDLASLAQRWRPAVKAAIEDETRRRHFWESTLRGAVAEAVHAGDDARAEALMAETLEQFSQSDQTPVGAVHIVGAGPGDPELLTLKAFRLIQQADIVFYDKLVSPEILDMVRRDAERVPVGKSKGEHLVPQDGIHELLIAAAREGKRVVRLKGGDPFIFGRGGEEVDALREAGIEADVVPGITSALGCAASARLPLTHRDHAQSVTFVTGHAQKGGVPDLDWPALARPHQTVVVFMGVGTAGIISEKLREAGLPGDTPVAVIENGTRENEKRAFGQIADLSSVIEARGIKGPALLIIGAVASLPREAQTLIIEKALA